jgi:hypothetical protein
VPDADLAAQLTEERHGHFALNDAAPWLVAARRVARGRPHGSDTLPVEIYQWMSLPGVVAGEYVGERVPFLAGARDDPKWVQRTEGLWNSPENRSWVLAGGLYAATSLWWGTVGALVAMRKSGFRPGPREPRQITTR